MLFLLFAAIGIATVCCAVSAWNEISQEEETLEQYGKRKGIS